MVFKQVKPLKKFNQPGSGCVTAARSCKAGDNRPNPSQHARHESQASQAAQQI
jgi:hypothetical protein